MNYASKNVKILLITGAFPALTFICRMVAVLALRGHSITIAARNQGDWGQSDDTLRPDQVKVHYLPPDSDLSSLRRGITAGLLAVGQTARRPRAAHRLWRSCAANAGRREAWRLYLRYLPFFSLPRPDIIQFEFLVTAAQYPLLPHLMNAPSVVSCRGADVHMIEQRDPQEQQARLDALWQATAIHCVSSELAETVERLIGRTEGVFVNRPAVEPARIPFRSRAAAGGCPRIITVGRLVWKKGYDYFLAALARLKETGVLFEALIIGDGELAAPLRFSIGDLGLAEQVHLAGGMPPSRVLEELQKADLFVLSSHEEGIANAALEAMAAGLPVVTTAAGGMAEVVRDGIDGFVVPVRDIEALTDRIGLLLADAALRAEMGNAARARIEEVFTLDRQAAIFEDIYRAAMQLHHTGGDRT
jgi:colanic acid/amylovoran biosynthesis glycosyltransferase